MSTVHPDDFKGALGSWAAGVTVVTAKLDGLVYGITVSSFSSLSVDPLLVLVSIQNGNHLTRMIPEARAFAVSILASDQEAVSAAFSKSGREPGSTLGPDVPVVEWHTGSPIVEGSIAHLDCELETAIPGGDHTIMIGRVLGASSNPAKLPLLYFRRGYRKLALD
ncbi:MAG: flavin reductase [Anaerolinea sp.]|nr:flavin reductase [Anaerolinea sp.]